MNICILLPVLAALTLNTAVVGAPTVGVDFETTPIPEGLNDTDDAAFWPDIRNPLKSEILGVSKYDKSPFSGGLGVYDLHGNEKQFLKVGRLNNIEVSLVKGHYHAFATHREHHALSVFLKNNRGKWRNINNIPVLDDQGKTYEPYGLCAYGAAIAITDKYGKIYLYDYTPGALFLSGQIDLAVDAKQYDDFLKEVVIRSAGDKSSKRRMKKNMRRRFIAEGCVFDKETGDLYIAQENLGLWRYSPHTGDGNPTLIKRIDGSFKDAEEKEYKLTDDLEGISIYYGNDRKYLLVSSQGIDKIVMFDLTDMSYVDSFQFSYRGHDPVTKTDGVLVVSYSIPDLFPNGFVVLHDHENEEPDGEKGNANYKIIDWLKLGY